MGGQEEDSNGALMQMQQYADVGFLHCWEGLLSTQGKENGMIGDTVVAVQTMGQVVFRLVCADNDDGDGFSNGSSNGASNGSSNGSSNGLVGQARGGSSREEAAEEKAAVEALGPGRPGE
jgi:hypothetical protein